MLLHSFWHHNITLNGIEQSDTQIVLVTVFQNVPFYILFSKCHHVEYLVADKHISNYSKLRYLTVLVDCELDLNLKIAAISKFYFRIIYMSDAALHLGIFIFGIIFSEKSQWSLIPG